MAVDMEIADSWAAQKFCAKTVHSLGEAELAMSGWQLDLMQMSPGRITYSLSALQLGMIQIFRERADKSLLKRGTSWPGSLVLSFVINAQGTGWLSGHEVDPQISLVVDGQFLPEIVTPHSLDLVYVAINRAWLAAQLTTYGQDRLAGYIRTSPSIAMWHDERPSFDPQFLRLLSDFSAVQPMQLLPVASSVQNCVFDFLLTTLTSARKIEAVSDTNSKRIIDKARRLMFRDGADLPTVAEVAAHLGISRRHLQTCFNKSVGLTATEFIRAERLNMVRKALIEARLNNKNAVIGDIAAQWGFWHLSRFAADYRDMFAELPSETLRNSDQNDRSKTAVTSQNG